jgi:hypothetical protein
MSHDRPHPNPLPHPPPLRFGAMQERFHGPRKAALCAPEPRKSRRGRVSVLDCASPLALWKSCVVESARGLAHSKTSRWSERFMGRGQPLSGSGFADENPANPAARICARRKAILPLPGSSRRGAAKVEGDGRGEISPKHISRFEPLNLVGTRSTASPSSASGNQGRGGTRPYRMRRAVNGEGER